MQPSNIPTNMPSVEKLLTRISVAERSQQKEVRISIQEARELATDLALLTSKLGRTVQDIHILLQSIKQSSETSSIKMDGGKF